MYPTLGCPYKIIHNFALNMNDDHYKYVLKNLINSLEKYIATYIPVSYTTKCNHQLIHFIIRDKDWGCFFFFSYKEMKYIHISNQDIFYTHGLESWK